MLNWIKKLFAPVDHENDPSAAYFPVYHETDHLQWLKQQQKQQQSTKE